MTQRLTMKLEALPVEIIAAIMEELDLETLVAVCYLSRRMRDIASDECLNPWRRPVYHSLQSGKCLNTLKHLSVRSTVPRQNWIEILSIAPPSFLLFEVTWPNLSEAEWCECFKRRFLPGWQKWK